MTAYNRIKEAIDLKPLTVAELSDATGLSKTTIYGEVTAAVKRGSMYREQVYKQTGTKPAYAYGVTKPPRKTSNADLSGVFLDRLQDFDIGKATNINLDDFKLGTFYTAITRRNATVREIPDRLAEIVAFCLHTKYAIRNTDNYDVCKEDLHDIENYLMGLVIFVNQLRNADNYWNDDISITDLFDKRDDQTLQKIKEHYTTYCHKNGIVP